MKTPLWILPALLVAAVPASEACAAPLKSVVDYFHQIPARHFAGLGESRRALLLKRRGSIVDRPLRFVQIPGGAGDVHLLQVTVFRHGQADTVAVSRIVWQGSRLPATLHFYRRVGNTLRDVTRQVCSYRLTSYMNTANARPMRAWEIAQLPRRGTTITCGISETDRTTKLLLWRGGRFVARDAPVDSGP